MLARSGILAFLAVTALYLPAYANPDSLAPSGWSPERDGAMTKYTSPSGQERIVVREITSHKDPLDAAREIARGSDVAAQDCTIQKTDGLARCDGELSISGGKILIRIYVADNGVGLTGLLHMGLSTESGLRQRLDESGARMAALSTASAQNRPVTVPLPAPGRSAKMYRVLFDLSYSYGVGGGVYPKYTPVYLFDNGGACRCSDLAPGDVNLTILRGTRPEDVGTWRRSGAEYAVKYADGDSDELNPSVGPPSPLPKGKLVGRYAAIGGGGNTSLGGSTIVVASKDYDFRSNGTFYQESFGGGGNGVVTAGSSRGTLGRWRLDGPTLTLSYPNGTTLRTSAYWSSKGDLVNGVPDVIWIGGKSFTLED